MVKENLCIKCLSVDSNGTKRRSMSKTFNCPDCGKNYIPDNIKVQVGEMIMSNDLYHKALGAYWKITNLGTTVHCILKRTEQMRY